MFRVRLFIVCCFLIPTVGVMGTPVRGQEVPAVKRGEYVFRAAGGCTCHTDYKNNGAFMAGGRRIKTPFGSIYSTNITPAPKTGIGTWSDQQFVTAMTKGVAPNGKHYFPVFPYTSFTRMARRDLLDLKAYLASLPAVEQDNKPPDMAPPFSWRFGLVIWNWLYFDPGTYESDAKQSPPWNRGAYLSRALAHCHECHTPRNMLGGLKRSMAYAGTAAGPDGELAPNITPDEKTGIGSWSIEDIVWFLQTGLKPNGDDVQGSMSEVIEHGFKYLSEADLRAIAVYLRSLTPIQNKVVAKSSDASK